MTASPTPVRLVCWNVTGRLLDKLDDIAFMLRQTGDDEERHLPTLLLVTETMLIGHADYLALAERGISIVGSNHEPSRGSVTRGMGGVAALSLDQNIIVSKIKEDAAGVLTAKVTSKDKSFMPFAITVAYVPHRMSTHKVDAAGVLKIVEEHAALFGKSYPHGRHLVMGDFNKRLGPIEDFHDTEDVTPNVDQKLLAFLHKTGLRPVHGRPGSAPSPTTSMAPTARGAAATDGTLPNTRRNHEGNITSDGLSTVDYIFSHVNTDPSIVMPRPSIHWQAAAGLPTTHRPVIAIFNAPASARGQPAPAAKAPTPTPRTVIPHPRAYGDTDAWRRFAAFVDAARLASTLPGGPLNATDHDAQAIMTTLGDTLSRAALATMPHEVPNPIALATQIALGKDARKWVEGLPLPPSIVKVFHQIRVVRRAWQTAKARHRINTANRLVLLYKSLNAHGKCLRRAYLRTWHGRIVDTIEELRHTDRHRQHQLIAQLCPTTSGSSTATSRTTIPDGDDGTPAFEHFESFAKQLYSTLGPPPPAVDEGNESMARDVPKVAGDHSWLDQPFTPSEVWLTTFPAHRNVQPTSCPRGCKLCEMYTKQHAAHYASPLAVEAPEWKPHARTSVAPGPDGIRAEWLTWPRCDDDDDTFRYRWSICETMAQAANASLKSGTVPLLAEQHRTTPLFKSGDAAAASDHRFLTIGNTLPKVMWLLVASRLSHWTMRHEAVLGGEQIGFKPHHSCEWHVWTLRETIKAEWREGRSVFALFVDLRKAFDMVHPAALSAVLLKMGIPPRLVKLLSEKMAHRTTKMTINGTSTDPIHMAMGVGQGCVISPLLFNLYIASLNLLLKRTPGLEGVSISARDRQGRLQSVTILSLFYADDLVIVAKSADQIQLALLVCEQWCREWGMQLGTDRGKTEGVAFDSPAARGQPPHDAATPCPPPLTMASGTIIRWSDSYRYLGWVVTRRLDDPDSKAATTMEAKFTQYIRAAPTLWATSPATLSEVFRTYVLSSCNYLLSTLELTPETTSAIDRTIIQAARMIAHTGDNATKTEMLIESRILPIGAIALRERTRLFLHLERPAFTDAIAPRLFAVLNHATTTELEAAAGRPLSASAASRRGLRGYVSSSYAMPRSSTCRPQYLSALSGPPYRRPYTPAQSPLSK